MFRSPRSARRISAVVALTLIMTLGATPAFAAMSRSLVMARAQRWVDLTIPYSQTTYRDLDGKAVGYGLGYRTDCSGFVSMAWNTFKPGYSTRTLHQTATAITKEALQPGDALVSYNYHAVIFGGWVPGTDRTKFYEYQMGSEVTPGDGTGMRVEWYPGPAPKDRPYIPYRLNGITENIDYSGFIKTIQGSNRYKTAVAASVEAFAAGSAKSVVIASGENWPDALGASALAGAVNGPVLLTRPDSLPGEVANELKRLGATEAIIVGSDAAVSDGVQDSLDALAGVDTTRVAGPDRYATSARIAEEAVRRLRLSGTYSGTVFVTTGVNFPDALAASPLAAKSGWPILLTAPDSLSRDAGNAIKSVGANRALVLGSASAVATSTDIDLSALMGEGSSVTRLQGKTRYDTGYEIAEYGLANCGLAMTGPAIATGENFPDALAGGIMAAKQGTVLLLTPPRWLDSDVSDLLFANAATVGQPRVLGGESSLLPIVREAIALAVGSGSEPTP